jgi:peptide deformylase
MQDQEVVSLAVRRILNSSHHILRGKAEPVAAVNSTIVKLLDDMVETMYEAKGVGLAAPQIGIAKRLIVLDAGDRNVLQLINPCIVNVEGNCVDVEGCLSVPGIFGEVERAEKVTVTAMDKEGRELQLEAEGLLARILQHEIDHLDGTLFVDKAVRMVDPEEFERGQEDRK